MTLLSIKKGHFAFLGFFLFSCVSRKVITYNFPSNPTSYTFKINKEEFGRAFRAYYFKYHNSLNFDKRDISYYGDDKDRIWPENAKKLLYEPNNHFDVYMELSSDSSPVYFGKKGNALKYYMDCLIHIVPLSDSLKVEIKVMNSYVEVGEHKIPSPPHFVNNPIFRKVHPTTIEEYKILLCIGKGLRIEGKMPALKFQ